MTPEVLWELAPWSWAVDWFSNTGDVIHNISTLGYDGLVMEYGYMMTHTQYDRRVEATALVNGVSVSARTVSRRETKRRTVATPYGFGIDDTTLSPRQLAILAALGLSRRNPG